MGFLDAIPGLIGNVISGSMASSATKDANAQRQADAAAERSRQDYYATNGIRLRVADAKAAGIHPLFAMGANVSMPSPVAVGVETNTGPAKAMANMGQDISRAVNATRTAPERDQAFMDTANTLTLQKMGLQNQVLAAQLAKLRDNPNPAMPASGDVTLKPKDAEGTTTLNIGSRIEASPHYSDAQELENRYGEVGETLGGVMNMWHDYMQTTGSRDEALRLNPFHRDRFDPARKLLMDRLRSHRYDQQQGSTGRR